MSEHLILEIPEELAHRARALASAANRRLEDAVLDWIREAVDEPNVESLDDAAVLALCDAMLPVDQQEELSDLLAGNREGTLTAADRSRLDALIDIYQRGMIRKARALKEAVARGLRPPLSDDAA
jgi:hypothetical protein